MLDLGGGDPILKRVARETGLVGFLGQYGILPVAVHLIGPNGGRPRLSAGGRSRRGVRAGGDGRRAQRGARAQPSLARTAFEETIQANPILTRTLERGARLVWMPRLEPANEIDSRRLTFAAAEAGRGKPDQTPIGPWRRQQIAVWRREMEEAFAPVAARLP